MPLYVALIDGKPGAYGVVVPDLPGCTSAAATADQALRNAVEAVRLWVDQAKADGIAVPAAPSIEALRRDPEVIEALAEGAALAMVPLIREAGRPRRVNMKM
jgi:predicted RNase H-like HicB family nuclease